MMFKRDLIFQQFAPVVYDLEEISLSGDFKVSGLCKVYQTDWSDVDILREANSLDLILVKDNEKASSYSKIDRGYDVILIYNKNDRSIMISIARAQRNNNKQKRRRELQCSG